MPSHSFAAASMAASRFFGPQPGFCSASTLRTSVARSVAGVASHFSWLMSTFTSPDTPNSANWSFGPKSAAASAIFSHAASHRPARCMDALWSSTALTLCGGVGVMMTGRSRFKYGRAKASASAATIRQRSNSSHGCSRRLRRSICGGEASRNRVALNVMLLARHLPDEVREDRPGDQRRADEKPGREKIHSCVLRRASARRDWLAWSNSSSTKSSGWFGDGDLVDDAAFFQRGLQLGLVRGEPRAVAGAGLRGVHINAAARLHVLPHGGLAEIQIHLRGVEDLHRAHVVPRRRRGARAPAPIRRPARENRTGAARGCACG